ncbi:MAG: hypothetical protein ACWA5Q_11745 [bacterium]
MSATQSGEIFNQPRHSTFKMVVLTVIALVLSAAILGFGTLSYYEQMLESGPAQPVWQRHDLSSGRPTRVDLAADSYPFIQYQLDNQLPGTQQVLFWRTRENPDQFGYKELPPSSSKSLLLPLFNHPDWQGTIKEIGIGQYETDKRLPHITSISLLPYADTHLLKGIFNTWRSPLLRDHKTINYFQGVPPYTPVFPVPALASLTILTLIIYWVLAFLLRMPRDHRLLLGLPVLMWMLLDARWQILLIDQVLETQQQYQGKSWDEKQQTGQDAELFRFSEAIKTKLPDQPSRVFIIKNRHIGHDYQRVRLQYFLLPHSVFNFADQPLGDKTRPGDFLVIFNNTRGVRYSRYKDSLIWPDNQALPVRKLYESAVGTLYQADRPTRDSES